MTAEMDAKQKEMTQLYRNVFGSPEGRLVLGNILRDNHFGVPLNSEAERIEYNVAVLIARRSGIFEAVETALEMKEESDGRNSAVLG